MHWIFVGIALGVGLMLVPYVIGIAIDIILAPVVLPIVIVESITKRIRGKG